MCRSASFHDRPCFGEVAFYDCEEGREAGGGGGASLHNAEEADLACLLFKGAMPAVLLRRMRYFWLRTHCRLELQLLLSPVASALQTLCALLADTKTHDCSAFRHINAVCSRLYACMTSTYVCRVAQALSGRGA